MSGSQLHAEASLSTNLNIPVDLSQCDNEPVRYPAAVMPHGVILILAPDTLQIEGVSANITTQLGIAVENALGKPLDNLLSAGAVTDLRLHLRNLTPGRPPRYVGEHAGVNGQTAFDMLMHRSGEHVVLELESRPLTTPTPSVVARYTNIAESIRALQSAPTWQLAMQVAVEELKRLCRFDTVIGVRMLSDGSLQAVAEARGEMLPSYLDKRFPKSDIPESARQQLRMSPLQYTPDMNYVPVPLIKTSPELDLQHFDLGSAVLRSCSPICARFLP